MFLECFFAKNVKASLFLELTQRLDSEEHQSNQLE